MAADTSRARKTRLLAAALTGALWVASGVLGSVLAVPPDPPGLAVALVPQTVELKFATYAWPVHPPLLEQWAVALAGGAMVAALTAMFLEPLAKRKMSRRAMLLAVWACIALASAAGALTMGLALHGILNGWPPPRPRYLMSALVPHVAVGVYWGALWGWLPALIAATRDAAAPAHSPGPGLGSRPPGAYFVPVAGLVVAGAFVLALLPSPEPSGPADGHANGQAYGQEAAPLPAPVPAPVEEPVVYGAELIGHAFEEPDPAWCNGDEVRMDIDGFDAGLGSRVGTLLVAPYSGTLRQGLEVDLDLTEPGFLTVTSWTPAGPDAPPPGSLPMP